MEDDNSDRTEANVLSRPDHVVLETLDLGFRWTTVDPFIFTVHHLAWNERSCYTGQSSLIRGRSTLRFRSRIRQVNADFCGG